MFNISKDFANMKEEDCTPSNLLKIFAINEIVLSSDDWNSTFNTHAIFDKYHIYLTEPSQKTREYREKIKNDKINYKFPMVFPDDNDYKKILLSEVKSIRDEVRTWFDFIIKNQSIDESKLNDFMINHNMQLNTTGLIDKFEPDFYISPCFDNLKSFIISHDLILPLYKGYGKDFKRIKRCPECKKYFYAKDLRQIFCGIECKNTNYYKNKKEKN